MPIEKAVNRRDATSELMLDLAVDARWIGKKMNIINLQGQMVMQITITSKYQKIDISKLQPGMYFIQSRKEDDQSLKIKFIKL